MHLDIRYPIGLLLTVYGAMLCAQGAFVRTAVLGVNVDLYWGAFMAVCGLVMLGLARRARRNTEGTARGRRRMGRAR